MEERPEKPRAANMDDFFTLQYRTGTIFNQLTEQRAQVVPVLQWKKLKANLTRQFGHKASLIMSLIGYTLGSSIAEEIMANLAEPEAFSRYLSDVLAATGWGIFSIHGDTQYGSKYIVSAANCGFCDKEDLADSPQCHFLVGALKGMADTLYGVPHTVSESRCAAMGDSVCEMVVEECGDPGARCADCGVSKFCGFALAKSSDNQQGDEPQKVTVS